MSTYPAKELVEDTIDEIKKEQKERRVKSKKKFGLILALKILFFPFFFIYFIVVKFNRFFKLRLTTKMIIIFTVGFSHIIAFFIIFNILFTRNFLNNAGFDPYEYMSFLTWLTYVNIILGGVFVALFIGLVLAVSTMMLRPIRKISKKIDSITTENLSERIGTIDTQDELMDLTAKINKMLDEIEDVFKRQNNFIGDASHELKTPLAVISGYASMLNRWGSEKPDVLEEGIGNIQKESDNMKRILEQLLLLARLGSMNMSKTEFDLKQELLSLMYDYRMLSENHEINFVCNHSEVFVTLDKELLLLSVRAFVDNAIKYTPTGGNISINCEIKEEDEKIAISVKDTGIGIAKEELSKIFDRFYRVDKVRGREDGSAGLGLAIAKQIVTMMGGVIHVYSTPNSGSNFMLELPIDRE
ncbi:MAG: HAMP domain-containing histidine kinase [Firmicutes bacterium]|nr:HAMP domain-containing histidine kinase [Bacillota bacterium]